VVNRIRNCVCVSDYEALTRERLSPMAWEYIIGAAGDELTTRWNAEAFSKIKLQPRALVDVSQLDTRVELLGQRLAHPILLAPTAYQKLVHPDGEVAVARGAGRAEAVYCISSFATMSVEEIAAVASAPLWFQLYMQRDRGHTQALVERVQHAGCRALCLTVDTPVLGTRNREQRIEFALPANMERPHLKGLALDAELRPAHRPQEDTIYSAVINPTLVWKDVEWLRSIAKMPLLLKGILHPEDAERAIAIGANGIIVSNHGGRNLDTAPATIEVLPRIVERVAGRMTVIVDGGVRRGTDVLKALALGAGAVMIGRPYLFGLGAAGEDGVAAVINLLRRELEAAMALTGTTNLSGIGRGVLWEEQC
jgi:4-hydroxymandelate oxidase